MKKSLLSLFSLALAATSLLAQTTELPDLTLCSTAQSVNLVIGGSVDDTTMKIDRGDGILNEYPLIADEATAITLSPVDAETPIKIYGVADRMNYFASQNSGKPLPPLHSAPPASLPERRGAAASAPPLLRSGNRDLSLSHENDPV